MLASLIACVLPVRFFLYYFLGTPVSDMGQSQIDCNFTTNIRLGKLDLENSSLRLSSEVSLCCAKLTELNSTTETATDQKRKAKEKDDSKEIKVKMMHSLSGY